MAFGLVHNFVVDGSSFYDSRNKKEKTSFNVEITFA